MFNRILTAITNYPQLKAVALAIAVAVWFYANTRLQEEATLRVPITLQVPQGHRLVYQSHRSIQLRLRGPQYLIQRRQEEADQNSLRMSVHLTEERIGNGVTELEVDPTWLNIPGSEMVQISVVDIRPRKIRVRASRDISRTLPVKVQLSGSPRRGYQMREAESIPAEVTVSGPAFVLERMEAVQTEEVALWDARIDFRRIVPLQLERMARVDENTEVPLTMEAEPSEVAVHVEIGGQRVERTLKGVPVLVLGPPSFPYDVEIPAEESTVQITLSGLPQELEEVTGADLLAFVDLSKMTVGEIQPGERALSKEYVLVRVEADADVAIKSIQPELVTTVLKNPLQ
jgi:hypothetical protein